MKLFKRLMVILGGSAAAALLIHALIVYIGFSGHENFIRGTVSQMQEDTLNQSVKGAVLGSSAYLEEKFNSRFKLLELIMMGNNPSEQSQKIFNEKENSDIDYI